MADSFEESVREAKSENNAELEAGDQCPKDHCERELHELRHPRGPKAHTERHPDAPETEVVCVHDGIVAER